MIGVLALHTFVGILKEEQGNQTFVPTRGLPSSPEPRGMNEKENYTKFHFIDRFSWLPSRNGLHEQIFFFLLNFRKILHRLRL